MDTITMDSQAWRELTAKIDTIDRYIRTVSREDPPLHEMFVDGVDIRRYLCISIRTLQRLRSKGVVNYSKIGGRCYYSLAEIKRLMDARLIRRTEEQLNELIRYHQTRLKIK